MFVGHLLNLFNVMLIVSGVLSLILYAVDSSSQVNLFLGVILLVVATANASLDFYQQYRTASLLDSFMSMIPAEALVMRSQALKRVPAAEVVCGDVLLIKSGDKVPADVRLFSITDLKVDNSSITGESEAQERSLAMAMKNALEATNLAFSGTTAVNGEGYGIVIRTGDKSVLGQIANMTIAESTPHSQLSIEIDIFVRKIALVAFLTAVIFFIVSMVMGYSFAVTFSFAVGIFVSFVPQGLPATVSVSMAPSAPLR